MADRLHRGRSYAVGQAIVVASYYRIAKQDENLRNVSHIKTSNIIGVYSRRRL
jgi:hypothetical protein